jgi:hypothetical protein
MKQNQDPLKTTVKGVKNAVYVRAVVRSIQAKIFDHGVCSDAEQAYLERHTNYGENKPLQTVF